MEATASDRSSLVRRIGGQLAWAGLLANGFAALVVFGFLAFLLPPGGSTLSRLAVRNLVAFAIVLPVTLVVGLRWINQRPFGAIARWLTSGRSAEANDRDLVLRYPMQWALQSLAIWALAAGIFSLLNADAGAKLAAEIAIGIVLGGLTGCAVQYLMVERIIRPITAVVLSETAAGELPSTGVRMRLTMAWLLTSAIPLLGAAALSVDELAAPGRSANQTFGAVIALCVIGVWVGLIAILLVARSVADPLKGVRRALEKIERGELDVRVRIDSATEVGLLQAGFNRMANGLGERERLSAAFAAYVDPGLAERVAAGGVDTSGDEVPLSVLFLDVRDFTAFAERCAPREVVARLNDLFGVVVPVVREHGGHANKFIGDGLLAVFGAPDRLDDHADRAVASALAIVAAVGARWRPDELRVGIGVNSGPAIVGTIGGGGRLDFTVVGDTVNTASRVEAVTRETDDDVLIAQDTVAALTREFGGFDERPPVALKGKSEPVRLFAPRVLVAARSA
jgi:adenylate cyclase